MHKTTIARALGYLARYKVEFVLSLAIRTGLLHFAVRPFQTKQPHGLPDLA